MPGIGIPYQVPQSSILMCTSNQVLYQVGCTSYRGTPTQRRCCERPSDRSWRSSVGSTTRLVHTYCTVLILFVYSHGIQYCIIIRMMLACRTLLARRTLLNQRAFCTVPTKPGSSIKVERGTDEAERAARDLVYGGQQPPPMPWAMMGFTAAVLGSYVAYHYLIELPREHALEALTEPVGPLPPQAHRRLPDGRLLMADGSIQSGDPSSTRQA